MTYGLALPAYWSVRQKQNCVSSTQLSSTNSVRLAICLCICPLQYAAPNLTLILTFDLFGCKLPHRLLLTLGTYDFDFLRFFVYKL